MPSIERPDSRAGRVGLDGCRPDAARLRPADQADPEGALLRLPRGVDEQRPGSVWTPGRRSAEGETAGRGRAGAARESLLDRPRDRDRPRAADAARGEPLAAEQVGRCRAWIDRGAGSPADEPPEADPRRHWAFVPPARPPVPGLRDGSGPRTRSTRSWPRCASGTGWCPLPAGRAARPAPPALPRPDRPAPDARRAPRVPRRPVRRGLRAGRRSAAGQPALRRALGAALDGRLAVQRLVRPTRRARRAQQLRP